MDETRALI